MGTGVFGDLVRDAEAVQEGDGGGCEGHNEFKGSGVAWGRAGCAGGELNGSVDRGMT